MKLGTFMMPLHPPDKPSTEAFDEDTQFVVDCETLGFTEVWCGHHVTLKWEPIVANDLFLANLIARTFVQRFRLVVCVGEWCPAAPKRTVAPSSSPLKVCVRYSL